MGDFREVKHQHLKKQNKDPGRENQKHSSQHKNKFHTESESVSPTLGLSTKAQASPMLRGS